jgi:Carboxypeptidase regulatory-like domain
MKFLSPTYAGSFGLAVRRNGPRLAVLLAAFFVMFAGQALAQEATIVGTVTDPTGAAVANASITITNTETGAARTVPTNGNGEYVAPDLIIGRYNVRAAAAGFKASEQKDLVLAVGDQRRLDFKLVVGNVQENVTVEANAVAVQTDSDEVSTVITGQQITELATNGRSLYELFALAPGASSIQTGRVGFTPVSADDNVSLNGQREGHNLQLIDGGENLDRGGSSGGVAPSLDSLAEFRNMTSNYSAEYGLASAGMITSVIKSGTKQFHAEAWELFRNDALDARNYFNPAPQKVAELRYNIYGFNVGGKIPGMNNHPTFFFYNQEWRSEIDGGLLNRVVPYTSTYGGNFSTNLPPDFLDVNKAQIPYSGLHVPCANQLSTAQQAVFIAAGQTFSTPLPVVSNGVTTLTCSPQSQNPVNSTPGVVSTQPVFSPFTGNTLPFVNANAAALLVAGGKYGGIFPAPNGTGANAQQFQGGNNSPTTLREEIARIDHTFSPKVTVFGHWISEQISQTYGTTQWSGDNVPSIADTFGNPSYSAVVHATYVISPTLLNETAFNYNGNRIHIIPDGLVGAPSSFGFNRLFTGPNQDTRIPSINLAGTTGADYTANWTPWNNKADDYQIRDDISWTKGAHQLKFGASWALYRKAQDAFANTEGNFTFNGLYTGNDFADYLLGYAQAYSEDGNKITGQWNNISPAVYVQDNWRASHRLTLNLGLRWDGIPHTYEANHLSSNFYPNLYKSADTATFDSNKNICSANSPSTVGYCGVTTLGGANIPSPGLFTSTNPQLGGYQFYLNGIGTGGVNGIPKGLVNDSWKNFGPRLGFAYDLTGRGKTVIRGGFGIMYERIQGNDMYNGAVNPPGDPNPTLNNVSLSNPGLSVTSGTTITAAQLPVLPLGVTGIATHYPPPTSYQYSTGVEQSVGAHAVLNISYVGSHGSHENYYQAINLPPLAALPGEVAKGALDNTNVTYKGFGGIRLAYDGGNAIYNSLQTSLTGTIHRDLHLQAAYTYAKAQDSTTSVGSGGDLNNATNPYVGWKYDFGPSEFDRRNVFFTNFVYEIPLFRDSGSRLLKSTVGGWQFSAIITEETGAPLNLGVSGTTASSVIGNSGTRPNVTGPISYPKTKDGQTVTWFNGSAFSAPACATGPDCYGNLGFDAIRGPGRDNFDLSLKKAFAFTERFKLEFRADAFNAWNHTQFHGDDNNGGIGLNVNGSNFGQVTSAFDGRQFQLGLKLSF